MTAAALRRALRALGIKQRAAAAQLHVSPRALTYYLAGERAVPIEVSRRVGEWLVARAEEERAIRRALRSLAEGKHEPPASVAV